MAEMRVGARYYGAGSTVEVIVVRPAPVELTCAGEAMAETKPDTPGAPGDADVLLGKRYTDEQSGLVVMCTKSGTGPLAADGRELTLLAAKPLPSSD